MQFLAPLLHEINLIFKILDPWTFGNIFVWHLLAFAIFATFAFYTNPSDPGTFTTSYCQAENNSPSNIVCQKFGILYVNRKVVQTTFLQA